MNKFEKTLKELESEYCKIKDIAVVILFGSVARSDYSLRHSDLDLFIIVNKITPDKKTKKKISDKFNPIGSKNGVKLHLEFQGKKIDLEDHSLYEKMIEEGKVLYSNSILIIPTDSIGLHQFIIYTYSALKQSAKTRISQILNGHKSWYYQKGRKIEKKYKGITDNEKIIRLGRGTLMVSKDRQKDIERLFQQLDVDYSIKKIVYA